MRKYLETTPDQDPSGKMAEFVVSLKYEDIPEEVIELAKHALCDMMGSLIAGSTWECLPAVCETVKEFGGTPQSPVMIYGYMTSAPLAAFANATMGRACDMGDVHIDAGHVTEWTAPALLAALGLLDRPVSGKEFLTAYCAAAECGVRQQTCVGFNNYPATIPGEAGGFVFSSLGVSKLLGATKEEAWNALGMGYSVHSLAEGQKMIEGGTSMARLQHGWASFTGVMASVLAKKGATGPHGIYLGNSAGMLRYIGRDEADPEILYEDLGKRWRYYEGLTFKPYASCKLTHSLITSMIELRKEESLDYHDIEAIKCIVPPESDILIQPSRWRPQEAADALFSVPYTTAHAAMHDSIFLEAFEENELKDPEKLELMDKIQVEIDPQIGHEGFGIYDRHILIVKMKDGTEYKKITPFIKGHPKNPMTWEDTKKKVWSCVPYAAVKFPDEQYEKIIEMCEHFDELEDVNEFVKLCVPQK